MPLLQKIAPSSKGNSPLATRQGTLVVAGIAALLAGAVLLVFLQQYRNSVADDGAAAKVLVADGLVAKGSSGDVLASEGMLRTEKIRASQLEDGAITDASTLRGKVALNDVLPGQQLTAADFGAAKDELRSKLAGDQRAVAIKVDSSHGLLGPVRRGDHVDVLAGFNTEDQRGLGRPVVKTILSNILVLNAPKVEAGEADEEGTVVLRVESSDVPDVTYAADNGKIWLVLRPAAGAREPSTDITTLESLLYGKTPVRVTGKGGTGR